MSKRPRGLLAAHKQARGKDNQPIVTDLYVEQIEEHDELQSPTSHKKRRFSPINELSSQSQRHERSMADVEDWEDVKELFATAVDKYEAEQPEEAVELFRQVIHESDRLLRLYPDPFLLLSNGGNIGTFVWTIQPDGSSLHAKLPSLPIRDPIRTTDPLTTFHYVYGTSMLLLGKILEAYPALSKPVEPVGTPAFYLAALDVLEDGESASHSFSSHKFLREDWRLAVSVGRTLICLADEKLRRMTQPATIIPLINFQDDLWPKDSAFGPSFSRRPPLTRRVTLPPMSPHEIILQATDQFSRAMLHMPHPRRKRRHSMETDFSLELDDEMDGPPTMPGLGTKSRKHLKFLRPRVLYTIANDVLNIADRMPTASERESWAKWADEVFMQMELEEQTSEDWSHPIAAGRGRCWLIIGSTRFEAIEARIESGEQALDSDDVERARDALLRAVEQLEKAQMTQSTGLPMLQDPFIADVSPMLGEAFVTLATLTPEGPMKEQFFARAAAQGIDVDEADEVMDERE